jgi:hypothetical protein
MTDDERLVQKLRSQQQDLEGQLAALTTKRATAANAMADIAAEEQRCQPMLINGHAEQAQERLDRLSQQRARHQRVLAALDVEISRVTQERDSVIAVANEADVRIAKAARIVQRGQLAAEMQHWGSQMGRLQRELDAASVKHARVKQERFELDQSLRDEQWRETQRQSLTNFRKNNPTGFERVRQGF